MEKNSKRRNNVLNKEDLKEDNDMYDKDDDLSYRNFYFTSLSNQRRENTCVEGDNILVENNINNHNDLDECEMDNYLNMNYNRDHEISLKGNTYTSHLDCNMEGRKLFHYSDTHDFFQSYSTQFNEGCVDTDSFTLHSNNYPTNKINPYTPSQQNYENYYLSSQTDNSMSSNSFYHNYDYFHSLNQHNYPISQEYLYSIPYSFSFLNNKYTAQDNSKTRHRVEKEKVIRENLKINCELFINQVLNKFLQNEKFEIFILDLEKNSTFDFNLGYYHLLNDVVSNKQVSKDSNSERKYLKYDIYNNSDKIAKILRICSIIYSKTTKNSTTTKRELYYNDVELFKNTGCIDKILQDICHLFDISRFDLTVFPANKGLFAGNIKIYDSEMNNINNCSTFEKINIISYDYYLEEISVESNAEFILVVEKESIFFNLLNNKHFIESFPYCILITGKGYPDYMTKYFLNRVYNILKIRGGIKFYYFGDFDPHGMEIYLNYMFGCKSSSRDNVLMSVNEMNWVGLGYRDILEVIKSEGDNSVSLIKIDERDIKKIENMIEREIFDFDAWNNSLMNFNTKTSILKNLHRIKYELLNIKENGFKTEGEAIISKYMEFFVHILKSNLIQYEYGLNMELNCDNYCGKNTHIPVNHRGDIFNFQLCQDFYDYEDYLNEYEI